MAELRDLQRKLESIATLDDIVLAMRNLAAVYVRRAESTLEATRPYSHIVETALTEVLKRRNAAPQNSLPEPGPAAAIVFASDQGLCGTFNEKISEKAAQALAENPDLTLMAVGMRGADLLRRQGIEPALVIPAPTSLESIKTQVLQIAADLFKALQTSGADTLHVIYNRYDSMGSFSPDMRQVLPPLPDALAADADLTERPYEPILTMPPTDFLQHLLDEYVFIQVFQALLESHASENGARLLAMTAAANNIDRRRSELRKEFQSARQDAVTTELLDIVAGAEAMES